MDQRLDQIEARLERVGYAVFGNGTPGLAEVQRQHAAQLDRIDANIKALSESVQALVAQKADEDSRREGQRDSLRQIRALLIAALAIFGIGGGTALVRILELVQEVAR